MSFCACKQGYKNLPILRFCVAIASVTAVVERKPRYIDLLPVARSVGAAQQILTQETRVTWVVKVCCLTHLPSAAPHVLFAISVTSSVQISGVVRSISIFYSTAAHRIAVYYFAPLLVASALLEKARAVLV